MDHVIDINELRNRVLELLNQAERVDTVDGSLHVVAIFSDVVWVWNTAKEITFDEQVVQPDGAVEVLLDRPLLGRPCIDNRMYARQGLSKIACLDLTDRDGCMAAQIVETVKKRVKVPCKDSRVGGADRRIRVQVPRFGPEEVRRQFDEIFAEMYPGEAVDYLEDEEPQRDAPYQYAGWLEIGVTTRMCTSSAIATRLASGCYTRTRSSSRTRLTATRQKAATAR
jgi:hypothetical protein